MSSWENCGEVRYTEGYPYLLGLAVALWLAASPWRLPAVRYLLLLVLLLPGCGRPRDEGAEAAFRTKFQQGGELLQHAQEQSAVDLSAAHSLLVDAREAFLRAALLRPGNVETARQITAVTRRLREVETAIEKQRAEEKKRHENLSELIAQLQKLTVRQARLSQQSRQLLRRRLVPPQADLSKSSDRDNEIYDGNATENSHHNDRRLALPASTEQQAVLEGTAHLLESVKFQQDTLRGLLKQAFGGSSELPLTELDPASDLLAGAVAAQQQALAGLVPEAVQWPQVNIAFHTAAGRMQQAIESLRSLQPPSTDQKDNTQPPMNDNDRDEDLDLPDSDAKGNKSKPVSPGDFQAALSLRSLPIAELHFRGDPGRGVRQPAAARQAESGPCRRQSGEELVSIRRVIPLCAVALWLMPPALSAEGAVQVGSRNRQPLHQRAVRAAAGSRERRPAGDAQSAGRARTGRCHRPPPALRPGPPKTRLRDQLIAERDGILTVPPFAVQAGGETVMDRGVAPANPRAAPGDGDGSDDHGRADRVAGGSTRNGDRDLDQRRAV